MESFFLAETVKYLYLLFDEENVVNRHYDRLLFSTEGHLFPILEKLQEPFVDIYAENLSNNFNDFKQSSQVFGYNESCEPPDQEDRIGSPLNEFYLTQYFDAVGTSL
jgi:hypothetical protein